MQPQPDPKRLPLYWFAAYRLIPVLILLLAFAARIHDLGSNPLWFDEAMEYWVATAPPAELPQTVLQALQDPPLYSALLNVWQQLGEDEFTLRYLSLLVSVLSAAAIFALGAGLEGWSLGSAAAALMALLPPGIRFAQEVGQYALAVCALTLNLLALHKAGTTNRWSYWFNWALTGLIAVYTYFGAILVIGPAAAVTLAILIRQRNPASRRLLAVTAVILLLALPLATTWLPAQLFRGPTSDAFQVAVSTLAEEFANLSTRTQAMLAYQLTGFLQVPSPGQIYLQQAAAVVVFVLALLGVLTGIRRAGSSRLALRWFTLCALASWLTYYMAGRLGIYPYGGTRHALIFSPFILLVMAIGLRRLWRRQKLIAVLAFLAIMVIGFVSPSEPAEDLRTITDYWLRQRSSDTQTYVYHGAVPGFRYQLRLAEEAAGLTPLPVPPLWFIHCWQGKPENYCTADGVVYGRWIRSFSAAEKQAAILKAFVSPPEEFWLILSHTGDVERQDVLQLLGQNYTIDEQLEVPGAAVYLLSQQ
jgi:uncharacterized membrane protein